MIRSVKDDQADAADRNVLGEALIACSTDPMTGFYRDGCCRTGEEDLGVHTVCCVVTEEFLVFSRSAGNDLSTPMPEYNFPGLKEGDCWCLCAARWQEALEAGVAPKVKLAACEQSALDVIELDDLKDHIQPE